MNTHLRLSSVVPNGVSGKEAFAIEVIYSYLLKKHKQNKYSSICINQIGDDLKELIFKQGTSIYININYPTQEDFPIFTANEKNTTRLKIIHEGMLRIAEKDKKLDKIILEKIKQEILENKFSFDFVYKTFKYKNNFVATIIIHPEIDRVKFYLRIQSNNIEKCKILVFTSQPAIDFSSFFFFGKWKNEKEIFIYGKEKEIKFHVFVDKCKIEYINLTEYNAPPLFQMMNFYSSNQDKEQSHENWLNSLPSNITELLKKNQ